MRTFFSIRGNLFGQFRPVFSYDVFLIDLTHGIPLNTVDDLQHGGNLIRRHLLLQARAQGLQF